jgi:hypothetical protein
MSFGHLLLAKLDNTTTVFVGDGVYRRAVTTATEVADLQYRIQAGGGDPTVHPVARIGWLGRDISDQSALAAAIAPVVAQALVNALSGPNGHLISDGDVDRISDAVLDRASIRLAQ